MFFQSEIFVHWEDGRAQDGGRWHFWYNFWSWHKYYRPKQAQWWIWRSIYSPYWKLFNSFATFRTYLLQIMETNDMTQEEKQIFIDKSFADPADSEDMQSVIERFKKGFDMLLKLEN